MNQVDLILKKRDGGKLTEAEIDFLISGYVKGDIPDYQLSAFLMAVYFQGMTEVETATLTKLMRDSGIVLTHPNINGFKVDKHSTGGVGDKVSLILAPLVACVGLYVPMISGRALAHTGGTLDKLEAIPGFRTNLSLDEMETVLRETGSFLVGQTDNLTPADKKIYALRDATGTVNSIPLITASILSKKMAEGIDALVLDVKAGSGAIFKDQEKAWELAGMLVKTAHQFGLKTSAILSEMNQPLGKAVGNWLETKEAIETLQGKGPEDLTQLTLILSSQMLVLAGKVTSLTDGMNLLQEKLNNGEAFNKFLQLVEKHDGDTRPVKDTSIYPKSKFQAEIKSPQAGYVSEIQAREIGILSMNLGAGRKSMTDRIDYPAGILLNKKVGDIVEKGELLATAHAGSQQRMNENLSAIENAFTISSSKPEEQSLIFGMIDEKGKKSWDAEKMEFV